jgi:hypothetical protein
MLEKGKQKDKEQARQVMAKQKEIDDAAKKSHGIKVGFFAHNRTKISAQSSPEISRLQMVGSSEKR